MRQCDVSVWTADKLRQCAIAEDDNVPCRVDVDDCNSSALDWLFGACTPTLRKTHNTHNGDRGERHVHDNQGFTFEIAGELKIDLAGTSRRSMRDRCTIMIDANTDERDLTHQQPSN